MKTLKEKAIDKVIEIRPSARVNILFVMKCLDEYEKEILKLINEHHKKWGNSDYDDYFNELINKIKGK